MRKLIVRLGARRRAGSGTSSSTKFAEAEGYDAYACGASAGDCPYSDNACSTAWRLGYRRADSLDASVW